MSEISKIRCSNGDCLNIKDATARENLANMETRLSSVESTVNTITGTDGGNLATDTDINNLQEQIDTINGKGYMTESEVESFVDSYGIMDAPAVESKINSVLATKGYLTEVPSEYVTETELTNKKYLTAVPAEYVTETELTAKQYLKGVTLAVSVTNETLEFGLTATK